MPNLNARHITRLIRHAAPSQVVDGMGWYREAHTEAASIAAATGLTLENAAGLIAALSPMLAWDRNVVVAREVAAGRIPTGVLKRNLKKALMIRAGADAADVLGGLKVRAFWQGIATAGATDQVCVDRHAIDAALGIRHSDATRPTLTPLRYRTMADAYRRAARIMTREWGVEVSPAQAQAIAWVAWRDMHAWRRVAA